MNIKMIMDESGSMPRADKDEAEYGEFGLNVGLLIHPIQEADFRQYLKQNCPILLSKDTHITDLDSEEQEEVRSFIFNALKKCDIQIIYEAIYVNGFHYTEHVLLEEFLQKEMPPNPRVKVSKKHDNPSMQSKLIEGAILKAIAFVFERAGENHLIEVLTDRVENKLLEEVKGEINHIYDLHNPQENEYSGFDTQTHEVFRKKVVTTFEGLPVLPQNDYDVTILPKDHVLNLAADVVANSLYYHIGSLVQNSSVLPHLNAKDSVKGYELEDQIICYPNDFSDKHYMHTTNRRSQAQPGG